MLALACLLPFCLGAQQAPNWLPAVPGGHWVEFGESPFRMTRMPDYAGPEHCERSLLPLPNGVQTPSIQISTDHRYYKLRFEAHCFDTADWSNYVFCPGKAEDFVLNDPTRRYLAKIHNDSLFFYRYEVDEQALGRALAWVPTVVRHRGDVQAAWEEKYELRLVVVISAKDRRKQQRPPCLKIDTLGTLLPCTAANGLDVIGKFGEPTTFEVNGREYRIKPWREEGLIPGNELMWLQPYNEFDNARECWLLRPDNWASRDSMQFSVGLLNRFPETLRVLRTKLEHPIVFRSPVEVLSNQMLTCTITVAKADYLRMKDNVLHLTLDLNNGSTIQFNIGLKDS
jgi:hypothetical protein